MTTPVRRWGPVAGRPAFEERRTGVGPVPAVRTTGRDDRGTCATPNHGHAEGCRR